MTALLRWFTQQRLLVEQVDKLIRENNQLRGRLLDSRTELRDVRLRLEAQRSLTVAWVKIAHEARAALMQEEWPS